MKLKLLLIFLALIVSFTGCNLSGSRTGGDDSTDLRLCDGWGSEPTPDLVALLDIFAGENPSVNIIRYTNPDCFPALITTGVADSFWVGVGAQLIGTWVQTGDILPVTSIFNDNDWLSNYRSEVIDLVSQNGEIWSVPLNIHRLNVLWYNKQIFADNSLTPPVTLSDFFTVASDIDLLGITPLAISSEGIWAVTLLFESVLLAYMSPAKYRGLWNGTTEWDGTEVQNALNDVVDIFSYVNTNHADIEWVGAAQLLADGDAAMFIMADWTNSFLKANNLTPNVDYGWAPSPGTSGSYLMTCGSFAFCAKAPNSANAVKWLTICGSKEGQDAFNPIKGSIPARKDYDPSLYDEYLLDAMDDYAVSEIVPISWGGAASDNWAHAIRRVIDKFVVDIEDAGITKGQAVSTAQAGLVQAYIDYGN